MSEMEIVTNEGISFLAEEIEREAGELGITGKELLLWSILTVSGKPKMPE